MEMFMFPLSKSLYKYAAEALPNFQDVTQPTATKLPDIQVFYLPAYFG